MEYAVNGTVNKGNYTSTYVMPSFVRSFPEVETGVRMSQNKTIVKYDDKLFTEKKFLYADSTFFSLFSFKLLKGNPNTVLASPKMVVVTASTAKKYFGNEDPVGKILQIGSIGLELQVTGVTEDCPSNSQIKYDFIASFSTLGAAQKETYWEANYTTYLLLKNKTSIASLQAKITPFMKKEMASHISGNDYLTYELEPFKKIHLHSLYEGFEPNNSITYIYIVAAIALLILLIACFTYINLSTARSIERAKEVGIRKVAGAFKKQIFWQFISESLIIAVLALVLSLIIAALILPGFNQLADRQLAVSSLFTPYIAGIALLIILCLSMFAGSYPALILSGFQPIKVLKGSFKTSSSGLWLRKSLIVFQFIITVFLITSTFIIQSQLNYLQNKNLGYNREHILIFPLDQKMNTIISTIKSEFKNTPGIASVSRTVFDPTNIKGGYTMTKPGAASGTSNAVTANPVDEDFIKTAGIKIIAGTDLTAQDIKDVTPGSNKIFHFILNESASKEMGWTPREAIGQKMSLGDDRPGTVKAVVKDFHFSSLHNPIKPLVLFPDTYGSVLMVKLSGNNLTNTISSLENKWKTLVPHRPFEYTFLDENYNKLYSAELRLGKVLNIFAGIAVLLACLGLFGLSAYAIQQRTKEIGVRKVLGASVTNIALLVSNQFIRLVIIAFVIAAPLAWFVMNKWLQDFTYRINISWLIFALTGIIILLIAILTVSFQSVKAALSNPVKSLRTE